MYSLPGGQDTNITQGLPVTFVNVEDDHNEVKPPVDPIGWASDSKTVLLSDAWVFTGLQEHRRLERRDLRKQPGAIQGRLLGQLGRLLPQLDDHLKERAKGVR